MSSPSSEENLNDDGESDVDEIVNEQQLNELDKKIISNPSDYQSHLDLISLLGKCGELDRLREARQRMRNYFPLAPNIWLDWIKDERNVGAAAEEIEQLFEWAFNDYTSIELWFEYVKWACGYGDFEKTRNAFERAVQSVGLNVSKGCLIWDAYREFELAILSLYDPEMGAVSTDETKLLYKQQYDRLIKVYHRQLSLPLIGLENVFREYSDFLNGKPIDAAIETNYRNALKQLEVLRPYEDALVDSDGTDMNLDMYKKYLDYEGAQKNPARLQSLFERAVTDHCLNVELWLRYTTWLDRELKVPSIIMDVYRRSVANCPWSMHLWQNYLLALERNNSPWQQIENTFEKALEGGYSNVREAAELWLTHCYQVRRKLCSEKAENFLELRKVFERGEAFLKEKFGVQDWDAEFLYRKCFALVEASLLKDGSAFRRIWDEILAEGNARFASAWLEYLQIERQYGDVDHCRKLLFKAVNSASDFPESVFYALLQFERECGDLDNLDKAVIRIEQQTARLNERKAKMVPKKEDQQDKKMFEKSNKHRAAKNISSAENVRATLPVDRKRKSDNISKFTNVGLSLNGNGGESRSVVATDEDGFVAPSAPPTKKLKTRSDFTVPSSTSALTASSPRPSTSRDISRYDRTVFVSNLDFKVTERELEDIFSKVGPTTEIRLVTLRPGRSKGYGYVEFQDSSAVEEALKLDRHLIDNRPMYVSKCVDKESAAVVNQKQFQYSMGVEKNKLFVKNIPREASEASLEEIFRPFGNLVSVRLVVHKSGQSKGLAYIEYADEVAAANALLKTDGTFLLGRRLSVAISNPPPRHPSAETPLLTGNASTIPKFGATSMMPRSLTSKPKLGQENLVAKSEHVETDATAASSNKPKSNDEFRKMFMKN